MCPIFIAPMVASKKEITCRIQTIQPEESISELIKNGIKGEKQKNGKRLNRIALYCKIIHRNYGSTGLLYTVRLYIVTMVQPDCFIL